MLRQSNARKCTLAKEKQVCDLSTKNLVTRSGELEYRRKNRGDTKLKQSKIDSGSPVSDWAARSHEQ